MQGSDSPVGTDVLHEEKTLSVKRWMTRRLLTIDEEEPASRAFEILLMNDIRHLPVLAGERLVGIITDRDLREALVPAEPAGTEGSMYQTVKKIKAKMIMTPNPITVGPDEGIEQAARILLDRRIDCLPVLDGRKRLVGIITSTDILKAFLELSEMLGNIRRIDVVMEGWQYETACQILREQEISIISVGVTSTLDGKRIVFSFRVEASDRQRAEEILREKGYAVLPEA